MAETKVDIPPLSGAMEMVDLSIVANKALGRIHEDFAVLLTSLSATSSNEDERKRQLLRHLHCTRQQLLRLLVLINWRPWKVLRECVDTRGVIARAAELAKGMSELKSDLLRSAEGRIKDFQPIFDVNSALEVLTTGTYSELPENIRYRPPLFHPPDPPLRRQRRRLKWVTHLIHVRLLQAKLPSNVHVVKVRRGYVLLRAEGLYEALVTLSPVMDLPLTPDLRAAGVASTRASAASEGGEPSSRKGVSTQDLNGRDHAPMTSPKDVSLPSSPDVAKDGSLQRGGGAHLGVAAVDSLPVGQQRWSWELRRFTFLLNGPSLGPANEWELVKILNQHMLVSADAAVYEGLRARFGLPPLRGGAKEVKREGTGKAATVDGDVGVAEDDDKMTAADRGHETLAAAVAATTTDEISRPLLVMHQILSEVGGRLLVDELTQEAKDLLSDRTPSGLSILGSLEAGASPWRQHITISPSSTLKVGIRIDLWAKAPVFSDLKEPQVGSLARPAAADTQAAAAASVQEAASVRASSSSSSSQPQGGPSAPSTSSSAHGSVSQQQQGAVAAAAWKRPEPPYIEVGLDERGCLQILLAANSWHVPLPCPELPVSGFVSRRKPPEPDLWSPRASGGTAACGDDVLHPDSDPAAFSSSSDDDSDASDFCDGGDLPDTSDGGEDEGEEEEREGERIRRCNGGIVSGKALACQLSSGVGSIVALPTSRGRRRRNQVSKPLLGRMTLDELLVRASHVVARIQLEQLSRMICHNSRSTIRLVQPGRDGPVSRPPDVAETSSSGGSALDSPCEMELTSVVKTLETQAPAIRQRRWRRRKASSSLLPGEAGIFLESPVLECRSGGCPLLRIEKHVYSGRFTLHACSSAVTDSAASSSAAPFLDDFTTTAHQEEGASRAAASAFERKGEALPSLAALQEVARAFGQQLMKLHRWATVAALVAAAALSGLHRCGWDVSLSERFVRENPKSPIAQGRHNLLFALQSPPFPRSLPPLLAPEDRDRALALSGGAAVSSLQQPRQLLFYLGCQGGEGDPNYVLLVALGNHLRMPLQLVDCIVVPRRVYMPSACASRHQKTKSTSVPTSTSLSTRMPRHPLTQSLQLNLARALGWCRREVLKESLAAQLTVSTALFCVRRSGARVPLLGSQPGFQAPRDLPEPAVCCSGASRGRLAAAEKAAAHPQLMGMSSPASVGVDRLNDWRLLITAIGGVRLPCRIRRRTLPSPQPWRSPLNEAGGLLLHDSRGRERGQEPLGLGGAGRKDRAELVMPVNVNDYYGKNSDGRNTSRSRIGGSADADVSRGSSLVLVASPLHLNPSPASTAPIAPPPWYGIRRMELSLGDDVESGRVHVQLHGVFFSCSKPRTSSVRAGLLDRSSSLWASPASVHASKATTPSKVDVPERLPNYPSFSNVRQEPRCNLPTSMYTSSAADGPSAPPLGSFPGLVPSLLPSCSCGLEVLGGSPYGGGGPNMEACSVSAVYEEEKLAPGFVVQARHCDCASRANAGLRGGAARWRRERETMLAKRAAEAAAKLERAGSSSFRGNKRRRDGRNDEGRAMGGDRADPSRLGRPRAEGAMDVVDADGAMDLSQKDYKSVGLGGELNGLASNHRSSSTNNGVSGVTPASLHPPENGLVNPCSQIHEPRSAAIGAHTVTPVTANGSERNETDPSISSYYSDLTTSRPDPETRMCTCLSWSFDLEAGHSVLPSIQAVSSVLWNQTLLARLEMMLPTATLVEASARAARQHAAASRHQTEATLGRGRRGASGPSSRDANGTDTHFFSPLASLDKKGVHACPRIQETAPHTALERQEGAGMQDDQGVNGHATHGGDTDMQDVVLPPNGRDGIERAATENRPKHTPDFAMDGRVSHVKVEGGLDVRSEDALDLGKSLGKRLGPPAPAPNGAHSHDGVSPTGFVSPNYSYKPEKLSPLTAARDRGLFWHWPRVATIYLSDYSCSSAVLTLVPVVSSAGQEETQEPQRDDGTKHMTGSARDGGDASSSLDFAQCEFSITWEARDLSRRGMKKRRNAQKEPFSEAGAYPGAPQAMRPTPNYLQSLHASSPSGLLEDKGWAGRIVKDDITAWSVARKCRSGESYSSCVSESAELRVGTSGSSVSLQVDSCLDSMAAGYRSCLSTSTHGDISAIVPDDLSKPACGPCAYARLGVASHGDHGERERACRKVGVFPRPKAAHHDDVLSGLSSIGFSSSLHSDSESGSDLEPDLDLEDLEAAGGQSSSALRASGATDRTLLKEAWKKLLAAGGGSGGRTPSDLVRCRVRSSRPLPTIFLRALERYFEAREEGLALDAIAVCGLPLLRVCGVLSPTSLSDFGLAPSAIRLTPVTQQPMEPRTGEDGQDPAPGADASLGTERIYRIASGLAKGREPLGKLPFQLRIFFSPPQLPFLLLTMDLTCQPGGSSWIHINVPLVSVIANAQSDRAAADRLVRSAERLLSDGDSSLASAGAYVGGSVRRTAVWITVRCLQQKILQRFGSRIQCLTLDQALAPKLAERDAYRAEVETREALLRAGTQLNSQLLIHLPSELTGELVRTVMKVVTRTLWGL